MKNTESIEQYEYARQTLKQRKFLFFHLVVFVLGSIFFISYNELVQDTVTTATWWPYAVGVWALFLFLHGVNVLIVNKFMGKRWQEKQMEKLIHQQQLRINELRAKVEKDFPLVDVKRDLKQE